MKDLKGLMPAKLHLNHGRKSKKNINSYNELSRNNSEEAEVYLEDAYLWYELNQLDLGKKFYESIEKSISLISQRPFIGSDVYPGIRRIIIKKFPYGIYYHISEENKEIQIIGILHFRRDIQILEERS